MHPLQPPRPGRQWWHTTPGGGFSWIFHQPPQSWDQVFTTKPPFRVALAGHLQRCCQQPGEIATPWRGIERHQATMATSTPRSSHKGSVVPRRALGKDNSCCHGLGFLESLLRNRGISKSAEQFGGDLRAYLYHPLPRKVCFAGLWCETQRFCWRHQWSEGIPWELALILRLYPSCISNWHHFLSRGQEVTRVPVTHTHSIPDKHDHESSLLYMSHTYILKPY